MPGSRPYKLITVASTWEASSREVIQGRALAAMSQANLPAGYFGEAVLTIGYLWNLTGTRVLPDNKTPFEMLYGYKPDVSHLRVFGCRCFARIPPERRVKNMPHSSQALFTGYPDGVKGWRLRDCATGAFFNSRDVIFDEDSVMRTKDLTEGHRSSQHPTEPPQNIDGPSSSSSSLVPSPAETTPEQIVPRRSGRSRVDGS